MDINLLKILLDFGLVVLVWIVQLAIYPSFLYYQKEDLGRWHAVYTQRITYVVLPLMLGQLVIHSWLVISFRDLYHGLSWLLVIATWMITFIYAVPLHRHIGRQQHIAKNCKKLIRVNGVRVIIWSAIFVLDVIGLVKLSFY